MKIAITDRPIDAYIEKAWKRAEMEEIEDHAAAILRESKEGECIKDGFFHSSSSFPRRFQNGLRTTG